MTAYVPIPTGDQPVRLAGLPERVPDPQALLDRDVDLPAELADVADPRGERPDAVDVDGLRGQEREALVADVGAAVDAAPRTSRARGPHSPIVVHAFVDVVELGRAVRRQRVREDLLVAHAHAAAGHDPEPVVRRAA